MPLSISLSRIRLGYRDGTVLHTATSGPIPELDELRLVVRRNGAVAALGASRMNISYLSRIEPDVLVGLCIRAVESIGWTEEWSAIRASLDTRFPGLPAPGRMLIEMTAADGAARSADLPLSVWLGGVMAEQVPTNQTLFHADDRATLRRAEAYCARGFTDLKLRVGLAGIESDARRLGLLRRRFGERIALSVDANGRWTVGTALEYLAKLASYDLRYVEQPLAASDWDALLRLSEISPVPLMLDESLDSMAAVERLAASGAPMLAHLKLAKLGGLDRLMWAGRLLLAAGTDIMVGQMNEGVVSTLAAAHAAVALRARLCELYGADGLIFDPAGELAYTAGRLILPPGPGLGLVTHGTAGQTLWEQTA